MRTPKIGEKIKILNDSSEKIYKISELSIDGSYIVAKEFWKKKAQNTNILLENIIYLEPESLSGIEKNQLLDKFVKADFLPDFVTRHRELGVLNRLIKAYPNLDFWRNFNPNFQVKSLLWWFGGGKKDLIVAYNYFTLNLTTPQKSVNLQSEKIGEDVQINKKPKTFLDLLI